MRRAAGLWRHEVLGVRLGVLALVLAPLALTIAYTLATRGIWLHPPDSRYYLTMTSRDMGHPITDAVARTRAATGWRLAPWYFAGNEPTWQMVKTRALYPFLSIPFVWVSGLKHGTMYVPCASVIAFCWITARVLQRLYGPAVAALIAGAFGLTVTVTGLVWATTDALSLALSAVLVANLPIERRVARVNLVWLGFAGVALALTRQVGVLAPALAVAGWTWALVRERTWRNPWLGSMVVTIVVTGGMQLVLGTVAHVDTQGIVTRDQTTFSGVVRQLLRNARTVTTGDLRYMWDDDRLLYVLLGAALLMALLRFTKDLAATFWGGLASAYVLTSGVGFSAGMRYEIIMFPAAAVAAGGFAAWALDQLGSPFPTVREPEVEPDLKRELWIPQLAGCVVVLGLCIAVTAFGGSRSTAPTPALPSFPAAQGSQPYAVRPLAEPSAEVTLKAGLAQALAILSKKDTTLEGSFDWVHDLEYRVTSSADPGYARRAKDGTTITRINAMTASDMTAFSQAITFNGSVEPGTLQINSRQTTTYGQDVDFSVSDSAGVRHEGTATTLYPIWSTTDPGLVTAIVYAP
ncbi:hypothetical protein KGQ20_43485 [Catenulispora sp. NF23]|uniref:Glycosyltransferase RgtA/B/C/D-like domain-containing protein n=1 Tax=Catenulispora pinistramenti TaxID=2705254 RepID=A0ABS5L7P0_9ACTN|nr:hypothetical protein [Catenulispora pinistramenti]MBS2539627.1 hypothetical protein [Catenulispora pinistramenti]MBS2554388.1 hypothetical protein [Catenulispora pinistramenti]